MADSGAYYYIGGNLIIFKWELLQESSNVTIG